MSLRTRTRPRLVTALVATALAVGVAQAPASAGEERVQWGVSGRSKSPHCSFAAGEFTYTERPGEPGHFNAGYNVRIWDECARDGKVAHLRVRYKTWRPGGWVQEPWVTVASTAGDSVGDGYPINVKDVQLYVCDYSSAAGNHKCDYVT
ncbi:hypothetical protein ACIBCM_24700 [Streptomyces sp. NPDC051018]|uniref:hypothetical protein n=1 Tax=Streptomyces sp. NPDC051018 TaxID=3365639 RepID=UPI003796FFCB